MNRVTVIVLIIFLTSCLKAQDKYSRLDSLLTSRYESKEFSGVVLVAEGDKITYANALGYADHDQKIPLNLSSQFDLSSGSKLFTAVAVGQLVAQNRLSFDSKVSEFFPELSYLTNVEVQNLLTHSSGLGNFQSISGFSYEHVNSCIDVLPFLKEQPLLYETGDSVYYATGNLLVLGAIVEKISQMTFPDYVRKHILSKQGLNETSFDTYFEVQDYTGHDGKFARGYVKNEKGEIIEKNRYPDEKTLVTLSAGGMWASALDILKFDRAVFSGKLLNKQLLQTMTKPHVFTGWEDTYFGYVFNIVNVDTHKEGAGHAGNSSGHHSFNFYYKNADTTLIILTNYGFIDIFELAHGQIEPILFDK